MRSTAWIMLVGFLALIFSPHARALDELFVHNGRYVVIDDGGKLPEEIKKKILAADAQNYVIEERDGQKERVDTGKPLILDKKMRAEILKILKIEEDDSVFVKSLGEEKTTVAKVSSLEMRGEINPFGESSVAGVGLVLRAGQGVASIGQKNPFNETKKTKHLVQEGRKFAFSEKIKLIIDGHSVKQGEKDRSYDPYIFRVQAGEKDPVQALERSFGFYDKVEFDVYAGEIFNDDTVFFYMEGFGLCGFFIIFKKDKAEPLFPKCDQFSC